MILKVVRMMLAYAVENDYRRDKPDCALARYPANAATSPTAAIRFVQQKNGADLRIREHRSRH
jgi:hypothetical protein